MRICIDLDGVVAKLKNVGQSYDELDPVPGAVEKLQQLRDNGHYIILFTARHMKTCDGDVGKVIARIGQKTLNWLEKHQIPYDEIHFGKPWADIYIDDNGLRFETWEMIEGDGSNMPVNKEKQLKGTV